MPRVQGCKHGAMKNVPNLFHTSHSAALDPGDKPQDDTAVYGAT